MIVAVPNEAPAVTTPPLTVATEELEVVHEPPDGVPVHVVVDVPWPDKQILTTPPVIVGVLLLTVMVVEA